MLLLVASSEHTETINARPSSSPARPHFRLIRTKHQVQRELREVLFEGVQFEVAHVSNVLVPWDEMGDAHIYTDIRCVMVADM